MEKRVDHGDENGGFTSNLFGCSLLRAYRELSCFSREGMLRFQEGPSRKIIQKEGMKIRYTEEALKPNELFERAVKSSGI